MTDHLEKLTGVIRGELERIHAHTTREDCADIAQAVLSALPEMGFCRRGDVVEEAAKVADGERSLSQWSEYRDGYNTACNAIGQRIRALPEPPARSCTCHPDDKPPIPCPRKYALADCRAAAESLRATIRKGE